MSQNNVKLGAVKNSAFLANVSYDSTDKMKTRGFAKVENDKITLTNPSTNSSFEVVAQVDDDTTGFSGTVFKDPVSGEYTIAFRGTEIGNEKISA